jgi:hypothetical protein
MSPEEVELIADRAAERAVEKVLGVYGIDTKNPVEAQADMAHLRRWRKAVNKAATTGFLTTLSIIITGALAATWMGIKFALTGHQ